MTVTSTGRVIVAWDVRADWRDLPGDFDGSPVTLVPHDGAPGAARPPVAAT